MSRTRNALAICVWVAGGVASGQAPQVAKPAIEFPVLESNVFLQPSQPAPAAPSDTGQSPAAKADPAKAAVTVEELAKTVETLGKNLTVVTGDEKIKLVLGGAIIGDFYYNHARPVAPGIPFFLSPRSPFGFSQDSFDANARATTLFGLVSGPKVCNFDTGGLVVLSLFNDALVVDRYGILPIQAYAEAKNNDWRFAAGLQFNIFNPVNPTTMTFAYLGGSGNAGAGFPGQARVERYFHPDPESQVTLTAGLSEPVSTTVNNALRVNEDNGWPNVEGRAALALGPLQGEGLQAKRPFEVGISGLVGQMRTSDPATARRVVANTWGLGSDFRWAVTPRCGFQGEFFVGQTLGTYTAGILQNVNLVTFQGVHATGGWAEVYYYLCPEKLHTHVGYGIDDPLDRDLAPSQQVRNETYFANLVWDPSKYWRLGWELTYRRTEYTLVRNNDGLGFQTHVQFNF